VEAKVGLKERSIEFIMSIPHLATLWDMRSHQRYEPNNEIDIELRNENHKIHALLVDICIGGMRVVSTDKRIENSRFIAINVDTFNVTLPCEKIRRINYNYGIKFGYLDGEKIDKLVYFLDNYTKKPRNESLLEFMV
jgi:hypothetical protein